MRNVRMSLLAGAAAFALLAGAGGAMAQQGAQNQNGAPSAKENSTKPAPAKPAMNMQQHAQTGGSTGAKAGGAAALNTKTPQAHQASIASMAKQPAAKVENRTAQQTKKIGRKPQRLGANTQLKRNQSTAQNEHRAQARTNTAQRTEPNGSLKGLQGNASIPMQGSELTLTPEQRTRVRDTVIDAHGAPKVDHVDFNVRVGTLVPRSRIHAIPVPETLIQIDAGWRGFLYFVVGDDVVIVNPHDMRIVAVVPA